VGADVVVVGSINVDLLLTVDRHPRPGETLLGGGGTQSPGGKGANQAVAAARLGARTAMVGAVGSDAGAEVALRHLRAAGVDLGAVRTVPGPTGLAVVTLAEDGENTIVVVPGANAHVTPDAVTTAAEVVAGAAVCVLQAEIPLGSVALAARVAHDGGARVVLNVAPAAELPWDVLRLADPLVVNEHEAAILLGATDAPATVPDAGAPDGDPVASGRAAAGALHAGGARSVVVTLGREGAVVVDAEGTHHVPARPVTAVDTTGAGDAFVGAIAAGLARGLSLVEATGHAARVAAASVQRFGAQDSYPWHGDPLP
jgi:ribokinase